MPRPSPYRAIAVASTFSPRFEKVLGEAKRMRDRFGADLNLLYVGQKDDETTRKFSEALHAFALPAESNIHYLEGEPGVAILSALQDKKLELIIAGALEKKVVLHPFLGDVARRLVREAVCSVMLFTSPEREPKPLQRIVFVTDGSEFSKAALLQVLHLAEQEKPERVYVIRVLTTFDAARSADEPRSDAEEESEIEKFVLAAGETKVPIEARVIRGNTGFAAADFVNAVGADLLVVPVPKTETKHELPAHFAWINEVIPCNLWVIR